MVAAQVAVVVVVQVVVIAQEHTLVLAVTAAVLDYWVL
jgi:hypothetical protein